MAKLFEAKNVLAKCVSIELVANPKKNGRAEARATMEIVDEKSPHKGFQVTYSGNFTVQSIKYTRRDLIALGWQGKIVDSLIDDVKKAAKVVPIDVEIASHTYADSGKTTEWSTVRSIGRPAQEAPPPLDQKALMEVQQWLTEAAQEEAASGERPPFE